MLLCSREIVVLSEAEEDDPTTEELPVDPEAEVEADADDD